MKKILLIIGLLFSTSFYSQTGVEFVAKTVAVDKLIESGLNKFNGILDEQQRQLFLNASLLTGIVKTQMDDVFNNVNMELDKKQISVFNDLNNVQTDLERVIKGEVKNVNDMTLNLSNAITRLPFVDDNPTVTQAEVPVFTYSQNGRYAVRIRGINLNDERNYIVLNGKKYSNPVIPNQSTNEFHLDLTETDLFSDKIDIMEIVLFEDKWFVKDEEHKYTVSYNVLPQKIASVCIYFETVEKVKVIGATERDNVNKTAGSCDWSEETITFNRRNPNMKIDRSSVSIRETGQAHGGGDCSIDPNKITEFSFEGKATARKDCRPFHNEAGTTSCEITWQEYYEEDKYVPLTQSIDLLFDSQEVVQLPKNTYKYTKVEVTYHNGKSFTSQEGRFDKNFLSFNYDAGRKQAYVAFSPSLD